CHQVNNKYHHKQARECQHRFMLPVNRISLPKMSHSYFTTSEISLEDMSSLRNVSLDQPTQRLLARQLETDRHLAWKQPAFR
ncbi:hypothetical protein BgiBS90_035025, partial [Biomphalaria glabrata]